MHDLQQVPPAAMTAAQRRQEIAALLANGLVRLRAANAQAYVEGRSESGFDLGFSGYQVILQALPYKASSYAGLREVMLSEEGGDYSLRAKTGWAARSTPKIGWYVGYIEKPEAT